jgi:peptidyl-prolyl cis-trans isomerase D
MLGKLRKYSKSLIIYVLFGIIIAVFVLTFNVASPEGACGGGGGKKHVLAKVGENDIDIGIFNMGMALTIDPPDPVSDPSDYKAFQQEMMYRSTRFYRLKGDERFAYFLPMEKEVSNLKPEKVMNDLLETYLVSDEAFNMGLRVSDEEVQKRMIADFIEGETGQFRKSDYEKWVRFGLKVSIPAFEDFVKREILREKMIALVISQVNLHDAEIAYLVNERKSRINLEYIEVNAEILSDVMTVTDAERDDFIQKKIKEVEDYFNTHQSEFEISPRVKIKGIFIRAPYEEEMKKETDETRKAELKSQWDSAKTKAEEIVKELRAARAEELDSKFAIIAKEKSDHPESRDNGGIFPEWIGFQELALSPFGGEVSSAAKMEKGQISDPLKIKDGYWIIKADDFMEGRKIPLSEAKADIAKKLISREKANSKFKEIAETVLKKASEMKTGDLAEVVRILNEQYAPKAPFKVGETGMFPRLPESVYGITSKGADEIPGIGLSEDLKKALKSFSKENPVGNRLFSAQGSQSFFIVRLKDMIIPENTPSADEISKAKEESLRVEQIAQYSSWFRNVKNRAIVSGTCKVFDSFNTFLKNEMAEKEERIKKMMEEKQKERGKKPQ